VQVPAESGGVSVLRGGDGVVGCCRERGKPDSRGTFRRRHRGGQRRAPGGLCLGDDRGRWLADLGGDRPGERRLGFAADDHLQPEQVRLATRLVVSYFFGDCHCHGC